MLRFVSDENFNGDVVRGLLLRNADLDLVRVQDIGLLGAADPQVLEWAADNGRIVLTHDRATFPYHAFRRVIDEEPMPGTFVANDRLPIARTFDEILLIAECSEMADWAGRVLYLPL